MTVRLGDLLTIRAAARAAGYRSCTALHQALHAGRLRHVQIGGGMHLTTLAWVREYQAARLRDVTWGREHARRPGGRQDTPARDGG